MSDNFKAPISSIFNGMRCVAGNCTIIVNEVRLNLQGSASAKPFITVTYSAMFNDEKYNYSATISFQEFVARFVEWS